MAFLNPRHYKSTGETKYISSDTPIESDVPVVRGFFQKYVRSKKNESQCFDSIHFLLGIPQTIKERTTQEFMINGVEHDEECIIVIDNEIKVYSSSRRGLIYGCMAILQLMKDQSLACGLIYDYPVYPVRGVKVYLPGNNNIHYFKEFVDMICYYKYNTIMIEVGGAMEYKKHPEVNDGWVKYCEEMYEYSGKTKAIQEKTFSWLKNSIHVENGEGNYLSQEAVRDLVSYCKDRGLNVIPEVPSLSHCDYLLINHPEIKERMEDPYPDTYCPSNPKSYELLFDVLEEVIEVFEPEEMNIGHDEYYSIGLCQLCRDRKPEDIYVEDIRKIQNYLSEKGIRTIIWGEKLLNATLENGHPCGGARIRMRYENDEEIEEVPATYGAIDMVPNDLKILHWYWAIDEKYEEEYLRRGLQVVLGNFRGSSFIHWRQRMNHGLMGGIISNWSTLKEQNLQRNGFLFDLAYSARMFWDEHFDDDKAKELRKETFHELYRYNYHEALGHGGDGVRHIQVTHTTDRRIEYQAFVDGVFIEDELYRLGDYVLVYDDGTEARLPIIYGQNISNKDVSWDIRDELMVETTFSTCPVLIGETTFYKCIYENPYPNKMFKGLYIEKSPSQNCNIYAKELGLSNLLCNSLNASDEWGI